MRFRVDPRLGVVDPCLFFSIFIFFLSFFSSIRALFSQHFLFFFYHHDLHESDASQSGDLCIAGTPGEDTDHRTPTRKREKVVTWRTIRRRPFETHTRAEESNPFRWIETR